MGKRTCECDDALGQFCPKCHHLGDGVDGYITDTPSNREAYDTMVAATRAGCVGGAVGRKGPPLPTYKGGSRVTGGTNRSG